MEQYTFIGSLENGKSIYMDEKKHFAIEHDHRHLVEATPEELEGCYKIFPHMRPLPRVQGHAISDDHWRITCPHCSNVLEYEGYFDPDDISECQLCKTKFHCSSIVFDDGSHID